MHNNPLFGIPVIESRLLPKGHLFDHVEMFKTPDHIIVNGRFGYATWRFLHVVIPGAAVGEVGDE